MTEKEQHINKIKEILLNASDYTATIFAEPIYVNPGVNFPDEGLILSKHHLEALVREIKKL